MPDIRITIANLNKVILNLTPDSFNSLVNIAYVLLPESTKEEIIRQIKEKQKVIRESTFQNCVTVMGLKEYRLTNNWKNFYVIISGCYIYFYKQDLERVSSNRYSTVGRNVRMIKNELVLYNPLAKPVIIEKENDENNYKI